MIIHLSDYQYLFQKDDATLAVQEALYVCRKHPGSILKPVSYTHLDRARAHPSVPGDGRTQISGAWPVFSEHQRDRAAL